MFDLDHPFFRPLATRLAVVAVCFGWGVFETFQGSDAFALLFFGLSVYSAYRFFIAANSAPDASRSENDKPGQGD
ncbi:hypothetical protein [Celeribacter sp.]|uniref:hypothetical protein n=1 Tax=Celeribacter sp. TaxID=1890673 RepID=UPI003A9436F1